MPAFTNRLFRLYQRITSSIAFLPTLIALGLALLCLLSIVVEMNWLQHYKHNLELGLVKNAENARLILGTLIGGVISLMVFSFSMVMVVLSSAATSLSPRVLPGLVSSRNHQWVLGVYLGTIIDSLMLVATIQEGDDINVPSLGIYLALGLGLLCLCLFVVFIRTISLSIQVDYNLNRLYQQTLAQLEDQRRRWKAFEHSPVWPNDQDWTVTCSQRAGYFKAFNLSRALELLEAHERHMTVSVRNGFFVMPGHPLFRLEGPPDEELAQSLLDCFDFYVEEFADRHHVFGFKQISEIATKALSPGVNDPGTAIKAIDLLTVLLAERMRLPDYDVNADSSGQPRLFMREATLDELLLAVLGPIRAYGREDTQVLLNLLQAYKNLLFTQPSAEFEKVLLAHAGALLPDGSRERFTPLDRQALDAAMARLNECLRHHPPLPMLG